LRNLLGIGTDIPPPQECINVFPGGQRDNGYSLKFGYLHQTHGLGHVPTVPGDIASGFIADQFTIPHAGYASI
jgi:hypothetical protein